MTVDLVSVAWPRLGPNHTNAQDLNARVLYNLRNACECVLPPSLPMTISWGFLTIPHRTFPPAHTLHVKWS